jgi:hypothetical protein
MEQCEFCGYATYLPCRSDVGAAKCSSNSRRAETAADLPSIDPSDYSTYGAWLRALEYVRERQRRDAKDQEHAR